MVSSSRPGFSTRIASIPNHYDAREDFIRFPEIRNICIPASRLPCRLLHTRKATSFTTYKEPTTLPTFANVPSSFPQTSEDLRQVSMSYPQKSSKAINPYVFYRTRELKNKGLVQNLAMYRRPRATPLLSWSSSSSYVIPSKALVQQKSINLAPERSFSYSPVYTSRATYGGSRVSTPIDRTVAPRDCFDKWQDDYDYDEGGLMTVEDGSTIIVAPPGSVRTIARTKSGDVVTSDAQRRGQLTRAANVGDLRVGSTNERVDEDLGSPYSSRFELYGLTIGMRLRNHLLHLIDVLRLYQDFDMCSGCKLSYSQSLWCNADIPFQMSTIHPRTNNSSQS